jgi:hypothetical protein
MPSTPTINAPCNASLHHRQPKAGLPAAGAYDLVVANILRGPLLELAPRLSGYVRPGGRLALSGLLAEQVGPGSGGSFPGLVRMPRLQQGWRWMNRCAKTQHSGSRDTGRARPFVVADGSTLLCISAITRRCLMCRRHTRLPLTGSRSARTALGR